MLGHQLIILGDAHLGAVPAAIGESLAAFLDAAPDLGDCLLINGDLFDFWFAYRRAIPRRGFRIAGQLAALAHRLPIVMTGGNHDRWGDSFWEAECGIRFSRDRIRFGVGSRIVEAHHGDGLTEQRWVARSLHRITRSPVTSAVFRSLPVDLGLWLVDRFSHHLSQQTLDAAVLRRAAEAQRQWAEARLAADPGLGLLVLGHTHRPALTEPSPGQHYLNPGAWLDGLRYATASDDRVRLAQFS